MKKYYNAPVAEIYHLDLEDLIAESIPVKPDPVDPSESLSHKRTYELIWGDY